MTDWIEWRGGEQPVDDDVLVQVKLREPMFPDEDYIDLAEEWDWLVEGVDGDIVAYRIVKEPTS